MRKLEMPSGERVTLEEFASWILNPDAETVTPERAREIMEHCRDLMGNRYTADTFPWKYYIPDATRSGERIFLYAVRDYVLEGEGSAEAVFYLSSLDT